MRPPWWPTAPVVVALDDGTEITVTPCLRCGHPTITQNAYTDRPDARSLGRKHAARGLCMPCYDEIRQTAEWDRYAPRQHDRDDLLDEWALMHSGGESVEQAARRLGLTPAGLRTAIYRARRDTA